MPAHRSVDEVVTAIKDMSRQEREELLLKMSRMDGLMEDLEDINELLRSAREPRRPFDEFLAELRSEGHDV